MEKLKDTQYKQMFLDRGLTPMEEIANTKSKICCCDNEQYKYYLSCDDVRSYNPRKIHKRNPYTIDNIRRYIQLNNIKCVLLSEKYVSNDDNLVFMCGCGSIFEMSYHHFVKSTHCCGECSKLISSNKRKLNFDIIRNEFEKYGYTLISKDYKNIEDMLTYKDELGYMYLVPYHRFSKNHSSERYHQSNPYTIQNINNFLELNGINTVVIDTQYINNETPLKCLCSCGREYYTTLMQLQSFCHYRCEKCSHSQSYLEYKVELWLKGRNIEYCREYRFPNCKNKRALPFDFYLPRYNTCIEVQGRQHYIPDKMFGGVGQFNELIKRDNIKKKFCIDNGIKLICIPYSILASKFKYMDYLDDIINLT